MATTDWLRTFVAACQSGSISEAARNRHISQPAATAHIRSLEAAARTPLLLRRPDGVVPTSAGARLYAQLADPLERLEGVLVGLDRGELSIPRTPLRVGASREVFAGLLVTALPALSVPVTAVFGTDEELREGLIGDAIDLIVTSTQIARRDVVSEIVTWHRYRLVTSTRDPRPVPASLSDLATELAGASWVGYSRDLPTTRRFWKKHLHRPFDANVRLVAPDLRVVLSAVEAGVGAALIPAMVCGVGLQRGSIRELFAVGDLIEPRPLWVSARAATIDAPGLSALMCRLAEMASES